MMRIRRGLARRAKNGSIVLTGADTLWMNAGTELNSAVLGGNSGTASMTIQNGAVASFGSFTMNRSADSTATLTITGTDSALNLTHDARIGIGTGITTAILVENGGRFTTANTLRMDAAASMTVQGASSLLKATNTVTVGGGGVDGTTLNVLNGARLEANVLLVGNSSGGQATISGATTTAEVGNNLDVGLSTGVTGTLLISAGATVQSAQLRVGVAGGSTGTVTMTGGGTTFSGGTTRIGSSGSGTLDILDGAAYSSGITRIAEIAGSTGSVTVDGATSSFSPTRLSIGGSDGSTNGGTGTLTVRNGGAVNVAGTPASVWVWDDSTLALAGGTFTSGTLTFNGGSTLAVELRTGEFSAPITVGNALALGTDDATLEITLAPGFSAGLGDYFDLATYGSRTGMFSGYGEGDLVLAGDYEFQIHYAAGSGNTIRLATTMIPEPGTLGLLLGAAALLLARRRRA